MTTLSLIYLFLSFKTYPFFSCITIEIYIINSCFLHFSSSDLLDLPIVIKKFISFFFNWLAQSVCIAFFLSPKKKLTSTGKWKWMFVACTLITKILLIVYDTIYDSGFDFLRSYKCFVISSGNPNLNETIKFPFPINANCFGITYNKFFSKSALYCTTPRSSLVSVSFVSVSSLKGIRTSFFSFVFIWENFKTLIGAKTFPVPIGLII